MSFIEIDYSATMSQVRQLRELADRLSRIADNQVGESLDGLDASWEGETSEVFLRKGRKLKDYYKALAKKIDAVADSMERTANRLHALDQFFGG